MASLTEKARKKVGGLDAKASAVLLSCDEEEEDFLERLMVIDRMGKEEAFMKDVVRYFNPPYAKK